MAERYADGLATDVELSDARQAARPARLSLQQYAPFACCTATFPGYNVGLVTARAAVETRPSEYRAGRRAQAAAFIDLVGNPFRPAKALDPAWLRWQGGTVARLAQAAYKERRLPEGNLIPAHLALVADALEDAGCTDADLLGHLRGPGPHVRGCWALDLVLSKS
jgi:hypothetical protein